MYWSINQQKLPTKINLLNIETTSIAHMKTEKKGLKLKTLRGNQVSTHHYTLTSQNNTPINIWLAVNENRIPYFFELKIDNNNGHFIIKRQP